jgi:hypothetical protein
LIELGDHLFDHVDDPLDGLQKISFVVSHDADE